MNGLTEMERLFIISWAIQAVVFVMLLVVLWQLKRTKVARDYQETRLKIEGDYFEAKRRMTRAYNCLFPPQDSQ